MNCRTGAAGTHEVQADTFHNDENAANADQPACPRWLRGVMPVLLVAIGLASLAAAAWAYRATPHPRQWIGGLPHRGDVPFLGTPEPVVNKMLELAQVSGDDVVYDLGCGDGRIVIEAAERFGAHGVGVELDPDLVEMARATVRERGLEDLVAIKHADIFELDFHDATVVALFLWPTLNAQLVPQLSELKPGSRIVSHAFGIEGYVPDRVIEKPIPDADPGEHTLYLWTIPLKKAEGDAAGAGYKPTNARRVRSE